MGSLQSGNIVKSTFIYYTRNKDISDVRKIFTGAYTGVKGTFAESDAADVAGGAKRRIKSNDIRIWYTCSYFFIVASRFLA